MTAVCSWSGGKDSCLALYRALARKVPVTTLFTMLTEGEKVSRSHGISREVLEAQAGALGKTLAFGSATWDGYEKEFITHLRNFKNRGYEQIVFGDIDLAQHREWEEKVCAEAGVEALLPLWQEKRRGLVDEFFHAGFKAVIVSVRDEAMRPWLGKDFDEEFIHAAEKLGWDACGENGEFHTFVYNGPIFQRPVTYELTDVRRVKKYFLVSLKPSQSL